MTDATPAAPAVKLDLVVLDAPDIRGLADFYAAILGWQIVDESDDWITVRDPAAPGSTGIALQSAPDFVPPTWPDNAVPQQLHLDLDVPDLDAAERDVLAAGARATGLPAESGSDFRVYLDPAGHPFCLCRV
ncbi:glyoxalase [Frondihabitans sucicola]|uniref:Glyoxalase n=1 Tax=Frondihabitans sucicola TaxID=1268041 RepID=A0ABN6Y1B8_9MICO|nr:VOC family protein [Frondihabitans sucicola]BDZ49771.1 glyoxalase [Frondihabitans sucicola]